MAAVPMMGDSGGPHTSLSVDMTPSHYTTHPPLPQSTNLCAHPQHMTMTGLYEFHTRNRFQAVKFDQVCEFLVLLPKINYMLNHSKGKTFIAQTTRQFVQKTEQKM